MGSILKVENISKSFNPERKLLRNISFEVEENSITCLIGANGTGKTTLFNIISRLEDVDLYSSSRMMFRGINLLDKKAYELDSLGIARMFQGDQVFLDLSVEDNVGISHRPTFKRFWYRWYRQFLSNRNHRDKNYERDFLRYFDELMSDGNDSFEDRNKKAGELSFGQRRILGLISLLMGDHTLILLDEPTSGLNPKIVGVVKRILLELKKQGKTIFVIDHNVNFIKSMSDKVLYLSRGDIALKGKAEVVLSNEIVINDYLGMRYD